MFTVESNLWRTASGDLVETGHPDAAVLAYPSGTKLPDDVADREGLKAKPRSQDKAAAKSADKAVSKPADKSGDDLEALRAEAEKVGVAVDKRWGADRLRQEIADAKDKA